MYVCNGEIYSQYLCQLNRGLRGQVVFPWPSCSRGVLCWPPAAGSVYMAVLYAHAHSGFGSVFEHTHAHTQTHTQTQTHA